MACATCRPRHGRRSRWAGLTWTALTLSLVAAGCGPSGPKRIQVHGKVRFGGNPPLADGAVYFAPVRETAGTPTRGGYGTFEKGDGAFVVGSVRRDDGLVPGRYRVTIECWKRPPAGNGAPGVSYVLGNVSLPELEVAIDGPDPVSAEYDVPLTQ